MKAQLISVLLFFVLAIVPAIAAPAATAPTKAKAGKTAKVKIIVSPQAQKILDQHGASLKGGILRCRGSKKTYDIATGSGVLRVIPDPEVPGALAIAAYDLGNRYAELRVVFPEPPLNVIALTPLPVTKQVADKLFPRKTY